MFGKTFIFQSCLIGICGSRYLGHRTAEEKVNIRISSQPFAEQSVENRNQDFYLDLLHGNTPKDLYDKIR